MGLSAVRVRPLTPTKADPAGSANHYGLPLTLLVLAAARTGEQQ